MLEFGLSIIMFAFVMTALFSKAKVTKIIEDARVLYDVKLNQTFVKIQKKLLSDMETIIKQSK
jgi:hypothetical protein